ncbi:MarR family winged helix-turn-helix transcriptional regulator [Candidatus Formimonas warabiya]|uniref:MarR family transcriptional regulator n=1 Tax=Formimonas warabiya TaxID=1761012 RepID=A0A3G1KVZ6_FORW1|nr:MarR family transcriptional regulator [Candidatus Formimonas warabiya]ATW26590.1 MarR family transcriptional regulator [Candidatus Formimonas warabiya]
MDYRDDRVKQAEDVVQSFINISRTITKLTQQNAASLGLTLAQMGILNTISSFPGITLKEITARLCLSKSTVSVSIDDLVNKGLIERTTSEEDRREINLKVTSSGKELSRKSCDNAISYKAMVSVLEKIPQTDIQFLLGIHKQILTHLDTFC